MNYTYQKEQYDSATSDSSWDFSDYAGMGLEGEDESDWGEEDWID